MRSSRGAVRSPAGRREEVVGSRKMCRAGSRGAHEECVGGEQRAKLLRGQPEYGDWWPTGARASNRSCPASCQMYAAVAMATFALLCPTPGSVRQDEKGHREEIKRLPLKL
ncbi:hypothetical protein E2C01_036564 [Portunus trituberculatus]|uniref:Uncharacterized protein n=1 Tax=Portunus trituberculatus TaxID=210409 RepID=A0A5B7F5W7_PORTR|nr:hypothetical protein [Portunus trituberculatus]